MPTTTTTSPTTPEPRPRRRWQDYEQEVYEALRVSYPDADIVRDAKILGRNSKKKRQVDVLIRSNVASFSITIAVEAKYLSRKINVKDVESFEGMMRDIGADHGLLITEAGFSQAAIDRARNGDLKLELDILSVDELKNYQGEGGIPYSGKHGVCLFPPFGWVVDIRQILPWPATLYPRGMTLEEAQIRGPWMYVNFWHTTDDPVSSLAALVEFQNNDMALSYDSLHVSVHESPPVRKDGMKTHIRVATWRGLEGAEITGFVEFDGFIFYAVLFTNDDFANRNIAKLAYMLARLQPLTIDFDNTDQIAVLAEQAETEDDMVAKATCHYRIAWLFHQMEDRENALKHRRLCWRYNPEHYENIVQLIKDELEAGHLVNAEECALDFVSRAPTNPTVMQDLLHAYCSRDSFIESFHKLVDKLKTQYHGEALANVLYHYGIYFANEGDIKKFRQHLRQARKLFVDCNVHPDAVQHIDELLLTAPGIIRRKKRLYLSFVKSVGPPYPE